jgi:N-acetylglucosaminyl-diphospho-decaprenol L-rhamnosyltransferase
MPASSPRVAVAIVAWKHANLTIDCLRSIAAQIDDLPLWRVYVVDNASPDDSADQVERAIEGEGWGKWATLIRSPVNGGFAAGNNVAIRAAMKLQAPDYVLLLNPDTIVRPGALKSLLSFMEAHPEIGIAGGRSEFPDGTPQHCCFRFPTAINELSMYLQLGILDRLLRRYLTRIGILEEPSQVDWVSGAFMMVRRAVIDIGLLDEGYFLYYEETDFTLRARRAGWTCWHVPQSRVVHLVGQSSGITTSDEIARRRPQYWFESRRRYFLLNHGRFYAILADLFALTGVALAQVRRVVERKPLRQPRHFFRDLLRYGALLNGRRSLKPRVIEL